MSAWKERKHENQSVATRNIHFLSSCRAICSGCRRAQRPYLHVYWGLFCHQGSQISSTRASLGLGLDLGLLTEGTERWDLC